MLIFVIAIITVVILSACDVDKSVILFLVYAMLGGTVASAMFTPLLGIPIGLLVAGGLAGR